MLRFSERALLGNPGWVLDMVLSTYENSEKREALALLGERHNMTDSVLATKTVSLLTSRAANIKLKLMKLMIRSCRARRTPTLTLKDSTPTTILATKTVSLLTSRAASSKLKLKTLATLAVTRWDLSN